MLNRIERIWLMLGSIKREREAAMGFDYKGGLEKSNRQSSSSCSFLLISSLHLSWSNKARFNIHRGTEKRGRFGSGWYRITIFLLKRKSCSHPSGWHVVVHLSEARMLLFLFNVCYVSLWKEIANWSTISVSIKWTIEDVILPFNETQLD